MYLSQVDKIKIDLRKYPFVDEQIALIDGFNRAPRTRDCRATSVTTVADEKNGGVAPLDVFTCGQSPVRSRIPVTAIPSSFFSNPRPWFPFLLFERLAIIKKVRRHDEIPKQLKLQLRRWHRSAGQLSFKK